MAKKPNFPSKPCPGCGALIPARSQSQENCGWKAAGKVEKKVAGARAAKKPGRPKSAGTVTVADIEAVKALVDRLRRTGGYWRR